MVWLKQNLWWLSSLSVALFVGGIVAGSIVVVRMPADHFVAPRQAPVARHPVIRWMLKAIKNITGVLLIGLGVFMAVPLVPGPGLILVVIGVSLTDFPGKRAMELWLLRKHLVIDPINWLRRKFHRAPLESPASDD